MAQPLPSPALPIFPGLTWSESRWDGGVVYQLSHRGTVVGQLLREGGYWLVHAFDDRADVVAIADLREAAKALRGRLGWLDDAERQKAETQAREDWDVRYGSVDHDNAEAADAE